jgi:hypothetical protein
MMNNTFLTAILATALTAGGSPAFATGMQPAPIQIDKVAVYGGSVSDTGADNIGTRGWAVVTFTNEYNAPATEVVFALETRGAIVDRFDDVGSFATGIAIKHRFEGKQSDSEMDIVVEKATFADGTVWVNPDDPQ